eukprot:TRINITY_DN77009_c0_g1_i1.p1 TRINITY_DN77009_c0_g1~~TRINITY_DN77009_c0_g1_i1.p1  ORF type:complete len:282 (-),score=49.31 TRINITY_DN77009_c0_g1_i1:43-804(-)
MSRRRLAAAHQADASSSPWRELLFHLALVVCNAFCAVAELGPAGIEFLMKNEHRDGVILLPSGVQYKVLSEGSGDFHPLPDSKCLVHFAGTTLALTPGALEEDESAWNTFEKSSATLPATFAPFERVPGWAEALRHMVEGDRWEVYIPPELGYGNDGWGGQVKGDDVLIVRMELVEIQGGKEPAEKCNIEDWSGCSERQKLYLDRMMTASAAKRRVELKKLRYNKAAGLPDSHKKWFVQRLQLVTKLVARDEL